MIREAIIRQLVQNRDVLDIGSVGQTDSYSLWNLYNECTMRSLTGIDLPEAERVRDKTFGATPHDRDVRIVYGDMEQYDFGRTFDVIIAGDVLEHVKNQGLFLENIRKHLSDEGKFLLTTPNAKWLTALQPPNPTHTIWHDRYTLDRILTLTGFKILDLRYYYGNKASYNFFEKILTLRQGLLAVCEKACG